MRSLVVVCFLAGFSGSLALAEVRDRLAPVAGANQRVGGLLGKRFGLGVAELQRRLEAGTKSNEELAVLVEAGALMWDWAGSDPLRRAVEKAARELIEQSAGWRSVTSLRRGLRGLLAYYEVSGDKGALEAARRVADWASRNAPAWWDRDLGPAPLAGPACELFRHTGERRKLTQGMTGDMDQPQAPRMLRALWEGKKLVGVGGAPAEETLASLTGLVEIYRLTGEGSYLKAARQGWEQIVAGHRYVTGAVGWRGWLREDGMLPGEPGAEVGDAGVTAEWLRLNWELLRLTGDSRYGDEIERTLYNHLMALQDGGSGAWAAHAPLLGRRRYGAAGERSAATGLALALVRKAIWGAFEDGPGIVLYAGNEGTYEVGTSGGAKRVRFVLEANFPEQGQVRFVIGQGGSGRYAVYLRVPSWCRRYAAVAGGAAVQGRAGEWLRLEREWREGERIEIQMAMEVRWVSGAPTYAGHFALQRGPQVLALEAQLNPEVKFLHRAAPETGGEGGVAEVPGRLNAGQGRQAYAVPGLAVAAAVNRQVVTRTKLVLIPFAEAREYRTWLPEPARLVLGPVAVTAFCTESTSGDGPVRDSICDERVDTYRTARGEGREGSWYAVELDRPERVDRIVYRHGKVLRDGGWFDTTRGKPVVQIKRSHEGAWETVGRLESYPETNGREAPELADGQTFEVKLREPVHVVGIRVAGQAARQYSSCAELSAYGPTNGATAVGGMEWARSRARLAQRKRASDGQ